jgi:hypothetical protein
MELSRSDWATHLEEWRRSGETATRYCEEHGLKLGSLRYWSGRIRRESGAALNEAFEKPTRFARVRTVKAERRASRSHAPKAKPPRASRLVLVVGEVEVKVADDFDAEALGRVLDVLGVTGGAR